MDNETLQFCTALGAMLAAFFAGVIQHTNTQRDRRIEKQAIPLMDQKLEKLTVISDQIERVLERLDRIVNELRE